MSLVKLPYELVAYVVQHLDLGDIRNLSFSYRKFQFLLHKPYIAKLVLEVSPSNLPSNEFANILRRPMPRIL